MDAILKLCFLSLSIFMLSAESHGYLCTSDADCPSIIDSADEHYCCSNSLYTYCCDWSTWLTHAYDGDDDDGIFGHDDDDDGIFGHDDSHDDDDGFFDNEDGDDADVDDFISIKNGDAGSLTVGIILAITFGVIGFVVLIAVLIVVCVCCSTAGSDRRTTTHVYHSQAAPVATVTTSNMSSSAAPYYSTQQPPPYTTYNAGQRGNVTVMKY
ncbi:uncharacterized protein [Ptychodera flava]|uniref:uncharacterized protein n=1 Tax=Ptychodera flava TaxID=63121 RepID=UPI00396A4FA7